MVPAPAQDVNLLPRWLSWEVTLWRGSVSQSPGLLQSRTTCQESPDG